MNIQILRRRFLSLGAILGASVMLAGCFEAALLGGAAGVMVGADRRLAEVVLGDERIELTASNRLGPILGEKAHLNITSYNYTVLLTGEVPDAKARDDAEKTVTQIERVKGIVNELQVGSPSNLQSRGNDTFLTGRIKAAFIGPQKFSPLNVKVVSEAGIIYLLGLVTRKEADDATEIARGISGVKKVVRVFEYLPAVPAVESK